MISFDSFTSYISALAFVFLTFVPQGAFGQSQDYCAIARSAMQQASQIRGFRAKREVPCLVRDKEQVKHYLLETIRTKLPKGKLAMEGVVFKALGVIPENFNYEKGLIDLYVNQIGGYYDPEKDHFVMAAWMPALLQGTVAVHELTHGLQDQYFGLDSIMNPKLENSDMLMARSALVEGDANSVMFEHARRLAGQGPLAKEDNVESFMLQNIVGLKMMAAGSGVPESLQMMLIFPYTSGFRFAHELLKRGGYAEINKAFKRLPRSTEEILHLDKYFKAEPDFAEIRAEELRSQELSADAKLLYQDTMGEFTISSMLGMYLPDKAISVEAAKGWGGDRVAVFEDDSQQSVVWRTVWDSAKDAQEFYEAFRQSLKARYPKLDVSNLDFKKDGLSLQAQGSTATFMLRTKTL